MPLARKLKIIPPRKSGSIKLGPEDLAKVATPKGLVHLLRSKNVDVKRQRVL